MNYQALSPKYAVSPQIRLEDIAALKADGFKVVISNRPDGEEAGQPTAAQIKAACEEAGLAFYHCPMQGPSVNPDDVEVLRGLLQKDGKIFAFCRTGNRSSMFFQYAQA
ncbi:TIGR01244 family sulfur transferase [Salinispirillum marinum]|uniref:TIGR01244 family sulfur transferase n=2 Tax=Saccharospirillaceae TaxID=255527 RepID=A0ABV8BKK4_9GAMM